jgi:hypothetical protein
MKKHIKKIGLVVGLLAVMVAPGLGLVQPAAASSHNPIINCDVMGNTRVDKETCDRQRALVESQRRRDDLEKDADLGRTGQRDRGPILTGLFSCNNASPNIENQCIYRFTIAIFNLLAAGVGIAVIAGIIYGSIVYGTSGGAPQRSQQGVTIITNALIGLLAYFLMWSLINWLVPGGLFN